MAVDLSLLLAFETMRDGRGVSRARETLGLSQPAMSAPLARLRLPIDDQLFVRSDLDWVAVLPRDIAETDCSHAALRTVEMPP